MRFGLAHGRHAEPGGADSKQYVQGDVVESDQPLDEMFKNKFVRLPDEDEQPDE